MTNINVDLPLELHTKLKLKAVKESKTIQQVVNELLEKRVRA